MELSARDIFSFLDYNLSKYQGILTKLGTCTDIENVWFGIANFELSAHSMIMAGYYRFMFLLFGDMGTFKSSFI